MNSEQCQKEVENKQSEKMMNTISAGIDMADMTWEIKCREEDMKQRALENERRGKVEVYWELIYSFSYTTMRRRIVCINLKNI